MAVLVRRGRWAHSRAAIAPVVTAQYEKLAEAGWPVTAESIRAGVTDLFGGAFEAFLAK